MKNGGKTTCKRSQKTAENNLVSFFCPLVKHLYKDLSFKELSKKTGFITIFLLFFFARAGYSIVTMDPNAPVPVQPGAARSLHVERLHADE